MESSFTSFIGKVSDRRRRLIRLLLIDGTSASRWRRAWRRSGPASAFRLFVSLGPGDRALSRAAIRASGGVGPRPMPMTSSSSRAPDGRRVQVQWPGSRTVSSSATDQPGSIRMTRFKAMSAGSTTPGLTSEEAPATHPASLSVPRPRDRRRAPRRPRSSPPVPTTDPGSFDLLSSRPKGAESSKVCWPAGPAT